MFNIYGIDHLNLKVKNLDKTIEFYKQLFNFEVKESGFSQMSGMPFKIIGITNKLMLCLYEDKEFQKPCSTLGHIGLNIDFKKNMIEFLKENHIHINYYHPSGITTYPHSQSIYIEDPNGYELELTNNFGGGL